jgi:hypothetical protein
MFKSSWPCWQIGQALQKRWFYKVCTPHSCICPYESYMNNGTILNWRHSSIYKTYIICFLLQLANEESTAICVNKKFSLGRYKAGKHNGGLEPMCQQLAYISSQNNWRKAQYIYLRCLSLLKHEESTKYQAIYTESRLLNTKRSMRLLCILTIWGVCI